MNVFLFFVVCFTRLESRLTEPESAAIIIAAISANRSCGMFFFTYWYWFLAEIFLILGVEIILSLFVDKSMALFLLEEGNELYRSLFLFTFFAFPAIGNLITRSL